MNNIDWRARAQSLIDGPEADDFAEQYEAYLIAIVCALLDVADAIRSHQPQLDKLRELTDVAPVAEAVALLLRAARVDEQEDVER